MENTLNNEIAKTKLAIKNKLPTEHNFGLEAYLEYLLKEIDAKISLEGQSSKSRLAIKIGRYAEKIKC